MPFPTIVLPASIVLSGFGMFLFGLIVLFAAALLWERPLTLAVAQLPVLMALQLALVTGLCLIVSCLGAIYQDITSVVGHGSRVLFYCSPTLYGVDLVRETARQAAEQGSTFASWIPALYMLNPFAGLIAGYRDALFYGRFLEPSHWGLLVVQCAVVLFAGYRCYLYLDRRVIKFL